MKSYKETRNTQSIVYDSDLYSELSLSATCFCLNEGHHQVLQFKNTLRKNTSVQTSVQE
jgi:hypothetical protein